MSAKIEFIGSHSIQDELDFYESVKEYITPKLTQNNLSCKSDMDLKSKVIEWLEIKKLLEREKELRKELIAMSQDRDFTGSGIKVQKIVRKGSVDYSRIPELANIDLEQYRGESIECWMITHE